MYIKVDLASRLFKLAAIIVCLVNVDGIYYCLLVPKLRGEENNFKTLVDLKFCGFSFQAF